MRKSNTTKRIQMKPYLESESESNEDNSYKKEKKEKEKEIIQNNQNIYRCPKCPFIPLINVNDKENKIIIDCLKGHYNEMLFSEYISENFQKNINNFECSNCGQEKNIKKLLKLCYECQKIYCKDCFIFHNQKYSNHHLISIDKIDYICPLHKSKYTQYCFDCKKNLCNECVKNKTDKHKLLNYKNIDLKNNELNVLKNNLEKENETLYKIRQIFNDTISTLSNKFNDILSYKFLYLKFKNNIINTYETKDTNYQIIDNINNLKFINKELKIDKEMNELDIIYELFNFLDSIEYNDDYNNENNNINNKEDNNININENNNININDSSHTLDKNKNIYDIKNKIEEVSNEDDNDIERNSKSDINDKKFNRNNNFGKNIKDEDKWDNKTDNSKDKDNNIYKIGNDYIKKIGNKKNNQNRKNKDVTNNNNKYLNNNIFYPKNTNEQIYIPKINNSNIINIKNDIKNADNEIRNKFNQEKISKSIPLKNNIEEKYIIINNENSNKQKIPKDKNEILSDKYYPNTIKYESKDIKENGTKEKIISNNTSNDNKEKQSKKKIKKSIKKKKIKQNKPNEEKEKEPKKLIGNTNNILTNIIFNDEPNDKYANLNTNIFMENLEPENDSMITKSVDVNKLRKRINDQINLEENKNEKNKLKIDELKNNLNYNNIIKLDKNYITSDDDNNIDYKIEEVPPIININNNEKQTENKHGKRTKIIRKKKKKKLNIYKETQTPNKELEKKYIKIKDKSYIGTNKISDEIDLSNLNNIEKDNNNYINNYKNNYSQTPTREHKKPIIKENEKNNNENNNNDDNIDINTNDGDNAYKPDIKNIMNKYNNILTLNLNSDDKINSLRKSPIIKRKKIKKKKYIISLDNKGYFSPKFEEKQLKITKKTTLIRSKSKDRLKERKNSEDIFDYILSNNKTLKYKPINKQIFINQEKNTHNKDKNKDKNNIPKKNIKKVNNFEKVNNNMFKKNATLKIAHINNKLAVFLQNKEEIYLSDKNVSINKIKKSKNKLKKHKDDDDEKNNLNRSVDDCKNRHKRLKLYNEYTYDEIKYLMERSKSYKKISKYKKFTDKEKINCIKYENGISSLLQINSELFALGNLIGDIKIINFHNYKEVQTINEHDGTIISLTLLNDKSILSCSADRKMLKIRLSEDGTKYNVEFFFSGYENYIVKAIELMNSFRIVTCSWDDKLFVWQKINNNNYRNSLNFNEGERVFDILEINYKYFVSISESNELKLWSSNSFELVDSLKNIKCICSPSALCKINDIILSVLDYHEIQLVDIIEYQIVNKISVSDGNLSCMIKLNDNSLLIGEDYNSDKYCVFYLKQYYYEEKDLKPISNKKDKYYKTNKNNDKEIRALIQFSNGMILQGISGEYKGKDSGDLIIYY